MSHRTSKVGPIRERAKRFPETQLSIRIGLLLSLAAVVACNNPDKTDRDGDGFVTSADCDDSDAAIHPDAEEICDAVDNNCNDEVDEGVLLEFFIDSDSDGYGKGEPTLACQAPGAPFLTLKDAKFVFPA